jgi:uncharacterized membrane protein YbhN (UPF0104 family)
MAALGLSLLGYALWHQWPAVAMHLEHVGLLDGILAFGLAAIMLTASAIVFGLLVDARGTSGRLVFSAAGYYLVSQAIKYVPGRVWGLAYQIERLQQAVGAVSAATASITHLIIGLISSLLVLGVAIGGQLLVPLAGFVLLAVWVARGGIGPYVRRGGSVPPSAARFTLVVAGVSLEWCCYLAAVAVLCAALGAGDRWLMMGALYAVAWLLGSLVVLVPGGLGVREGGFVTLGPFAGIATGELVGFALVARFIFSGAELLTAGVAAAMLARQVPSTVRSKHGSTHEPR